MKASFLTKANLVRTMLDDAYLSITARPVRTLAMIAGILLGVASATATILIAETQQVRIDRQFDAQRSSNIVIEAKDPGPGVFTPEDAELLRSLDPVTAAGELSVWKDSTGVSLSRYTPPESVPMLGVTSTGLMASATETVEGVPHQMIDQYTSEDQPVVWIGEKLASRLGVELKPTTTIQVEGTTVTVAGIVANTEGFAYINSAVLLSPINAKTFYGSPGSSRLLAAVRPGSSKAVSEHALALLDPQRQYDLVDVTQPDGETLRKNVASDLRRIGLGLGAFMSLIGVIAVANTLTMAVTQRSRELGLRGAIGWSRARIGSLILLESAIAGIAAAIIGTAAGMFSAAVWCHFNNWDLIAPSWLVPAALACGTLASVFGGLLPAFRASSISPLEAMRS